MDFGSSGIVANYPLFSRALPAIADIDILLTPQVLPTATNEPTKATLQTPLTSTPAQPTPQPTLPASEAQLTEEIRPTSTVIDLPAIPIVESIVVPGYEEAGVTFNSLGAGQHNRSHNKQRRNLNRRGVVLYLPQLGDRKGTLLL